MAEQATLPEKTTNGTLRRWDPADMFQALHQEMERIWPHAFNVSYQPVPPTAPAPTGISYLPRMDVYEKGDMLVFKAELPFDVTPDKVQASLKDGVLEVQVPKPAEAKPKATQVPVA